MRINADLFNEDSIRAAWKRAFGELIVKNPNVKNQPAFLYGYRQSLLRQYFPFRVALQCVSEELLRVKAKPGDFLPRKSAAAFNNSSRVPIRRLVEKFQADWFVRLKISEIKMAEEISPRNPFEGVRDEGGEANPKLWGAFLVNPEILTHGQPTEVEIDFHAAPPLGAIFYGIDLPGVLAANLRPEDLGYVQVYVDLLAGKEALDGDARQIEKQFNVRGRRAEIERLRKRFLPEIPEYKFEPLEPDLLVIAGISEGKSFESLDIERSKAASAAKLKGQTVPKKDTSRKRFTKIRKILDPKGLSESAWYKKFAEEKQSTRAAVFKVACTELKKHFSARYRIKTVEEK